MTDLVATTMSTAHAHAHATLRDRGILISAFACVPADRAPTGSAPAT